MTIRQRAEEAMSELSGNGVLTYNLTDDIREFIIDTIYRAIRDAVEESQL